MNGTVPIAVIIPTYNRGNTVLSVLEKVYQCNPQPTEIWIHLDSPDGLLEVTLNRRFPEVRVLTSSIRSGPGAGRHRCLLACGTPFAVSFDDDSYPVDADFFSCVERLFSEHTRAAILAASIWHRHEAARPLRRTLVRTSSYIGCGYAIRLSAYRQVRGLIPRIVNYGMEESDLSLQLFAAGWHIYESGELRVFHDTDLSHHASPEITAGGIANVGLYAYLHYPVGAWWLFLLQLGNTVVFSIRMGRVRGIWSGILSIPRVCYENRQYRKPLPWSILQKYRYFKRTGCVQPPQ